MEEQTRPETAGSKTAKAETAAQTHSPPDPISRKMIRPIRRANLPAADPGQDRGLIVVEPKLERLRPEDIVVQLPQQPSIREAPAFRADALRNEPDDRLVHVTHATHGPRNTPLTRAAETTGPKATHEAAMFSAPQKMGRHRCQTRTWRRRSAAKTRKRRCQARRRTRRRSWKARNSHQ
jgi:hypothetical protein